ncbi:hypothetical protein F383_16435 [Gossypium arboreum]|uniref:Uncharacterized protein n=1 Tax=Gossypium arboreum TaxID=29729 RepID=A0A0B0N0R1_GOSAR|nr:hypothetical protein F383_28694 [Gossypium arboreum]KHG30235.1 hypothetical protein F383_16435 [Gossypium arboreum]
MPVYSATGRAYRTSIRNRIT